jgi:hypothetical protein
LYEEPYEEPLEDEDLEPDIGHSEDKVLANLNVLP